MRPEVRGDENRLTITLYQAHGKAMNREGVVSAGKALHFYMRRKYNQNLFLQLKDQSNLENLKQNIIYFYKNLFFFIINKTSFIYFIHK